MCNAVFVAIGLHKNPLAGMGFIGLAILLNAAAVVLALRATAAESPYGRQLLNGVLIGAIAGALIFATSWLVLAVVFPDSISEIKEGSAAFVQGLPIPEDQKEQQLAAIEGISAVGQAWQGFIGTFVTSAVLGAIAGAFLRKK